LSSSSDIDLCYSFDFRSLVEVSLFVFFFSFSLWLPNVCVVNALIKGETKDLRGSRSSGWSLPGVMSD
jgi:hypothetical protein